MSKRILALMGLLAASLFLSHNTASAHGFGGRGRTYTATGPATHIPAPALQMFGGYDGVPIAVHAGQVWQPSYHHHTMSHVTYAPVTTRRGRAR